MEKWWRLPSNSSSQWLWWLWLREVVTVMKYLKEGYWIFTEQTLSRKGIERWESMSCQVLMSFRTVLMCLWHTQDTNISHDCMIFESFIKSARLMCLFINYAIYIKMLVNIAKLWCAITYICFTRLHFWASMLSLLWWIEHMSPLITERHFCSRINVPHLCTQKGWSIN